MLKYIVVLVLSVTLFPLPAHTQSGATSRAQQFQPAVAPGDITQQIQREQAARLFAERQAQLRIDTAKLVALTAELKKQVDKTRPDILSLEVVKKAQEIQKLAKSVQDKMKNAY